MKIRSQRHLAIVLTVLTLSTVPSRAQDLKTVDNPAAGFSIDVPADWTALPLPTGLLGSAAERNERGQPVAMINIALEAKAFADLREEQRSGAERRNTEGDEHIFATLDHQAGPAFSYTRRTTTKGGLKQVNQAIYIESGGKVWRLNWIVPPRSDPDHLDALRSSVVSSFKTR